MTIVNRCKKDDLKKMVKVGLRVEHGVVVHRVYATNPLDVQLILKVVPSSLPDFVDGDFRIYPFLEEENV